MGILPLLYAKNAPLPSLHLYRLQLDYTSPSIAWTIEKTEGLLYSLTGGVSVYANGVCLGDIGGRSSVSTPLAQCIRFPSGKDFAVTVNLRGFAADLLYLAQPQPMKYMQSHKTPYMHINDTVFHRVGEGAHARVVAEVPRPDGYALDCGETLNDIGCVSSWPSHANAEDLEKFRRGETTWEEVMFFVAPKPGKVALDGYYSGNKPIREYSVIHSGDAMAMPLGSHPITAAPDAWMWYFWGYAGTALEKQYRKFATDVAIYRK